MKKLFLLFALLGAFSLSSSYAQSCSGAKKSAGCCAMKAAKAASADASIESRTSEDGTVSYVRKETDSEGNAKFVSVRYDEKEAKFVNVAPQGMAKKECTAQKSSCAAKKACCSKDAKKSCGAKASSSESMEQ